MSNKSSLLVIGFLVMVIAFFLSLSSSVGMFYGENYHMIIYLESDSKSLVSMLLTVTLFGIAPIVASLILHVAAYVKRNYAGIASLGTILLSIIGGLSTIWGYLYVHLHTSPTMMRFQAHIISTLLA